MGGTAEAAMAPSRCSICLEEVIYGGRRSSAKLQCNHEFHLDCIGSEFNMKGAMRCPNCRHVEKDGDWRYTNGRNDPPASALEIDDPFMDNQVIILEDLLEIDGFHLIPSFTTVNRRLRTDIDYYLSEIHRPIASSAYGAANALRENVTSSQGPSSSTAHNCNAISSQTHTLNTAEIYTPIDIRTDAAIHAESNQIFEPFAETYNMLGHATNPNSHAWVHPFQAHMQNGSFDSVSVPGTTTRATLNGLPNYSAAYSYSSAQNGRFHGLNLNNPPVYYASNSPQYGYPVSMPARTTRAMLNGQPNYSAAYSYPSGQNGRFHGLNLNNPPYYHASNPPQNGYRVSVHARTTRARLNGQQNYSAAYSYPSAQNGSFYGLNLNNLPYYHASNPPQNGYAASVHARTTRARLDGTENHSAAAYSYPSAQNGRLNLNNLPGSHASNPPHNGYVVSVLGVQHGSLEAVSEPRTSMTMFNSPNPTGMSNIHHFQQTYRSNARRAAESSTDLSLSIGSHHRAQEELHDAFQDNRNIFPHGPPTRVMRQPSHFGSSGTNSASTIHAQMTPYHRPPTALRRHAPRTDTLGTARNTMNNRQNDRRQNQH